MNQVFFYLDGIRLDILTQHPDQSWTYKLKLISIIMDLVIYNLMNLDPHKTARTVKLIERGMFAQSAELINKDPIEIKYGLNLIAELYSVFFYNLNQHSKNQLLNYCIKEELIKIMNGSVEAQNLVELATFNKFWNFDKFL